MKKILALMVIFALTISFVTGCGEKENSINTNIENDDTAHDEVELDGNDQKVSLLLDDESTDSIQIMFNTDRFAVEEYYLMEPQSIIYFTDKKNGNNYTISAVSLSGYTVEDYYDKLVNTAKRNAKADDFNATEMEDVTYGGINFKKFSVSWSKAYEYVSKEDGELISGVSNKEETAIFAQIKPGVFLRYEGPSDEEILKNLFVKIIK